MCANHTDDDESDGTHRSSDPGGTTGSYGRRSVLKGVLGAGGSAGLAGCFGGGDTPDQTATSSPTGGGGASPTELATDIPGRTTSVAQSATRPDDGVAVVPPGGDIQAAIDEVAGGGASDRGNGPWGKVRLKAGETYEISETIMMRIGSILEYNGARMVPDGDVDVIDVCASSYLKRPFIDARGVDGWDSTLIKVTTREGGTTGNNPTIVEQAYLYGTNEYTGTGIKVIDTNEEGLGFSQISGIIHKTRIGLHYRSEGVSSWVNSHQFDGWLRNNETNILMNSEPDRNAVNSNIINVGVQPREDVSEWFWDLQTGEENVVNATVWDVQRFNNPEIWRIGESAGQDNKLVDQSGGYKWENNVVEKLIGDAPNGAAGNVLFDYAKAHAQLDMRRQIDDIFERLDDLESA